MIRWSSTLNEPKEYIRRIIPWNIDPASILFLRIESCSACTFGRGLVGNRYVAIDWRFDCGQIGSWRVLRLSCAREDEGKKEELEHDNSRIAIKRRWQSLCMKDQVHIEVIKSVEREEEIV